MEKDSSGGGAVKNSSTSLVAWRRMPPVYRGEGLRQEPRSVVKDSSSGRGEGLQKEPGTAVNDSSRAAW